MNYERHKQNAASWAEGRTPEQVEERAMGELRSLMQDHRFSSVVWLLETHREEYIRAFSKQDLAAHRGCLEHCGGSVYAVDLLRNILKAQAGKLPVNPSPSQSE